jgi:FOG: Ankyrin repeat
VNARTREDTGFTPLHWASEKNSNPEVVTYLLQAGADWTVRTRLGLSPLDYVRKNIKLKDTDAHRILEEAETGSLFDTFFALCGKGSAREVRAAIKGGSFVKMGNREGITPLHIAAEKNPDPEVITVLLESGADANAKTKACDSWRSDLTPLHQAAAFNPNQEVIRRLLAAGALVNAKAQGGLAPLHSAAWNNNNPEITKELLKAGAEVNAGYDNGWTSLHCAAFKNPNPEIVLLLLKAGADGRAKENTGKTPFDYAEKNEKLKDTEAFWALHDASF